MSARGDIIIFISEPCKELDRIASIQLGEIAEE